MQRALRGGGRIYRGEHRGRRRPGPVSRPSPTPPSWTSCPGASGSSPAWTRRPSCSAARRCPSFPTSTASWTRLRKRVRLGDNDDFFIVFGPEEDCRTAAEEIRLRFVDATMGVPKETRQALAGGFTTFERILPGPDRMYPDTDSPPTRITAERVAEARARLRPPPWERIQRYGAWRVPEETADYFIRRGGADIVDAVVEQTGADGLLAGHRDRPAGQGPPARAASPWSGWAAAEWMQIFDLFTGGRIPREAIPAAGRPHGPGPGLDAAAAWPPWASGSSPARPGPEQPIGLSWRATAATGAIHDGKAPAIPRRARPWRAQRQGPGRGSGRVYQDEARSRRPPMSTHPLQRAQGPFPGLPRPRQGGAGEASASASGARWRWSTTAAPLQGRGPAPQRDLRRPAHRHQAVQRLQRGRGRRPHRGGPGDRLQEGRLQDPREGLPRDPQEGTSPCWAPAAPSPPAWTTAPAR